MTDHTITLVPLSDLQPHPGNPKTHDTDLLDTSLSEFGYIEPVVIDQRTGLLISGHGRREALLAMQEAGEEPPEGVVVNPVGEWEIPAVTGWASKDDLHAEAALVALNRIGERGGWEDKALLRILDRLSVEADPLVVAATGFDATATAILRRATEADLNVLADPFQAWEGMTDYTSGDKMAYKKIVVSFESQADVEEFNRRLEFPVDRSSPQPNSRNAVWFPWQDDVRVSHIELVDDEDPEAD